MKKLKLLMVQAGRSSDVTDASKWRRSSSRFSSGEEDSENDDLKTRLNSSMPPPSSNFRTSRRKSTGRLSEYAVTPSRMGRKDSNLRNDMLSAQKTGTLESEPSKKRNSRLSSSPGLNSGSLRNSSVRRISSRASVSSTVKDDFETGSDSDIDSKKWESNTGQVFSPSNSTESVSYSSSFLSRLSSVRPRHKSDCRGVDSSSVNTLLGFRKSFQSSSATNTADSWTATRSTTMPFQSNFVKRLSGLSSSTCSSRGSTPSSIFDVKENDDAPNSPNGLFTPSRRSGFSQSDLSQEFKTTEDEVKFGCNSQFVSMILLAVAALFFTVLAVMYVSVRSRDAVSFGLEDKGNTFPICPQKVGWSGSVTSEEELCVDHQELMPAVKLAKLLHPELNARAINQQCYGGHSAVMSHHEIIKWLVKKLNDPHLELHLRSLKVLLISNSHWGIRVVESAFGDATESTSNRRLVDAGGLAVTDPDLPLFCYLKTKVLGILYSFLCIVVGIYVLYGIKLATQWYMRHRERDKMEVYKMVERIIELLVNHQQNATPGKQPFLAVNHVRDQLIPPPDRSRLAKVWNKAVHWIKNSESRVRCELQSIAGEEFPVWRWLPHASISCISSAVSSEQSTPRRNNKVWQGQAFVIMSGSPNSPPCSPTPCLKIRHMFDPDVEFGDEWLVRVQDAILEKCGEEGVVALHISVDRGSREGCVYLKCASQEDAGKAYRALHGWWFDSNLVTVKYLRLERYHERFPEAKGAVVPLHPSNNQKLSLQWQSPLENN
ncbi:inner nuclear membrane protein Man1 isoform X2 [Zootermopsis nevadensis]|uniref:inner nuclear membrane protein Man1 isoform X2 n=1 Tax=Zootermopsis nevadensis TaxID=136037 RepID=UPI000B8E32AC|nr:inner nuclear membrane protein Man1 isoform X2 [Zootermopsis nevadensis]